MMSRREPELLAPAGDLEKLMMAIHYGADAVYIGGERFGLRAAASGFTFDEMAEGVRLAHAAKSRVYLTVNIFADNRDILELPSFIKEAAGTGIDALIISDPGVIDLTRELLPDMEIHLSTQANTMNWRSVAFWKRLGVSRVCVARELSIEEIQEIKERVEGMEIEAFIHGAMCISFSGRCLISSYMTGRSANKGDCAHPCRYKYTLMEETRPGEYFPIEEDDRGSYMMSSRDLCMIEHLDKLVRAGVDAFKIEGRIKGVAYVGNVVRIYREAIDSCRSDIMNYKVRHEWLDELKSVSNREYTTGFFLKRPDHEGQNYLTSSSYTSGKEFIGVVRKVERGTIFLEVRNRLRVGDVIEFTGPEKSHLLTIAEMRTLSGDPLFTAHAGTTVCIETGLDIDVNDMVRKVSSVSPS